MAVVVVVGAGAAAALGGVRGSRVCGDQLLACHFLSFSCRVLDRCGGRGQPDRCFIGMTSKAR